jgi:hypothetical protein
VRQPPQPPPASEPGYRAELPEQGEPQIGQELIRVYYDDGRVKELVLHDYATLYSIPGLYEEIVQRRLECSSPQRIATMLAQTAPQLGLRPEQLRAFDIAGGNGVSGEALAAAGLTPVIGTDIEDQAREAAQRDRPCLYERYLTLDLLALAPETEDELRALGLNVLSCVAPVGPHSDQLPVLALTAAASVLAPDALVAYMHDPIFKTADQVTANLWREQLGAQARLLTRERYLHRRTVGGGTYEMEAVIWRLRRPDGP